MSDPLVILDLDGPILGVSRRYFAAHMRVVAALGLKSAYQDAGDFWEAKRRRLSVAELLLDGTSGVETYTEAFKKTVESPDLLALDTVHEGALQAISDITGLADVVVISMRTNIVGAQEEAVRLGVAGPVTVHFVPHNPHGKVPCALELAREREVLAVVGDSEADAAMAVAVHAPFVGVDSGIRTDQGLRAAGAAAVFPELLKAVPWLTTRAACIQGAHRSLMSR